VLGAAIIPYYVIAVLPNNRLATYSEDDLGVPSITIRRITFTPAHGVTRK
jgi:hypothetical protein